MEVCIQRNPFPVIGAVAVGHGTTPWGAYSMGIYILKVPEAGSPRSECRASLPGMETPSSPRVCVPIASSYKDTNPRTSF